MSKTSHLYRRGNVLYFRLSVPERFRAILRVSEFTQSLRTQNRKDAIPAAYKLAGEAKTLFNYIDSLMLENYEIDENLLREVVEAIEKEEKEAAKKKDSGHSLKAMMAFKKKDIEIGILKERHEEELEQAIKDRELEIYRKLHTQPISTPQVQQEPIIAKISESDAPLLSIAYEKFIGDRAKNKSKVETFGRLFKNFIGEKKINQLTQKEVNQFFRLLVKCPGGRGGNSAAFNKMSIYERIADVEKNDLVLMGPSTFETTYVSSASQFFDFLNLNYEDYAPPLTTSHIDYEKYGGKRAKGEEKQRSLRDDEVERLIDCELMKGFAANPKTEHQFWLPMMGLFSGARVNELCQLNPQHDIVKDEKTGIWFFNLTDETPGGIGVVKSHKNDASKRKVPIHSKLIECGFLKYFERVKALGDDRIFTKWGLKQGKASERAEGFFRKYLVTVGLRDETIGKKVLGMHSLRGTFMTHTVKALMKQRGATQNQAMLMIQPIVGHTANAVDENGNDLKQTGGYVDQEELKELNENLSELRDIIEVLGYRIASCV